MNSALPEQSYRHTWAHNKLWIVDMWIAVKQCEKNPIDCQHLQNNKFETIEKQTLDSYVILYAIRVIKLSLLISFHPVMNISHVILNIFERLT